MKEDIISFKTAKLAREKGFKELCYSYYFEDGEFKEYQINDTYGYYGDEYTIDLEEFYENWNDKALTKKNGDRCFGCSKNSGYLNTFSAPTQSILQKWLREKYNIHVEVRIWSQGYGVVLFQNNFPIVQVNNNYIYWHKGYEEALEEGLFEALKLINNE